MPFAIIYFLFQLALAIATVVVVSRLYLAIKRTGAKGETFALIGAAMLASLALSARGLFVASNAIQAETPLPIDISDWLLVINDEFGRSAGDEALKVFGGVVGACLRKIDILGRMGGEKFAIVLPHTDVKGATIVAERVCAAVNRNIKLTFDKKNVRLTASVGVAALHDGNLENLLSVADGAMYSAKRAGRNQVVVESADVY